MRNKDEIIAKVNVNYKEGLSANQGTSKDGWSFEVTNYTTKTETALLAKNRFR